MAAPAAVLSILVRANTGPATTGLLRLNAQLGETDAKAQNAAKSVARLTRNVALIGAGATVAGLAYATKKAADFESQMSSLGAVTDATAKQMEQFRKQALKAGADTKFSALEAAEAQTELAKGGLKVQQIMRGGLRSALALAAAGEMELADAAEATVNAMKLFGLRGRDAMKVADGFATAANRTTADVSDFALALKMGGSAAKAAGLNFRETTVVLEALAEIGIKGSDAGTSMKAALTQLAAPTEKQLKLTKKLGLEFFDQQGKIKDLADISGMLRSKLGDMTEQQRLATVKTIAGTDGLRALLALYDAGPKKLTQFEKDLGKQGTAMDVAAKKQDNLKGALERLQGSFETLAIQIGTGLLPSIRTGIEQVEGYVDDVSRIFARDDLDLGEKLQKSFDLAKVRLEPWLQKLKVAIDQADIPEKLGNVISAATPVIAKGLAAAAVIGAKAFVTGFLSADIWGRLAIGAWLLARMGGPPAFMKVGSTAGAAMGTGMAAGAAEGVAAGGLKGKLSGLFRSWGPTLAIALAATFGPELVKRLKDAADPAVRAGLKFDEATKGAESFDALRDSVDRTADELEKGRIDKAFRGPAEKMREQLRETAREFDKLAEPVRRAETLIQNMSTGASSSVRSLREKVNLNTERIKQALGEDTKAGKDALTKNFLAAVNNIRTSMAHGTISVKAGTELIEEYMVQALRGMGFTKKQAIALRNRMPGSTQAPGPAGAPGLRPNARGGFQTGGKPTGDSIPSLLERGEYVVNRRAVAKVGKANLDRLNFGMAPRFQQGGIVELLHPGNDPKGHGDHLHVAMSTGAAIVALGKKLQGMGWLVGEHPAFGGVGGHTQGSYHYSGQAIDVNWPDPSQERAKIAALLPMLGGKMGSLEPVNLARALLSGPTSPLKGLAQGALDTQLAAAQSLVDSTGAGFEGSESGSFSGPWRQVMAAIAKGRGWSLADWTRLVNKESGGDPTARNPSSGAFGLGQFLGATAKAYAPFGALSSDPVQQIQAMAKYIGDRYGNPSAALAFHDKNNWYAAGGLVGGIGKALKKVRSSRKVGRKSVDKLLERIKGVGLGAGIEKNLKTFSTSANTYGEFADRAGALTTEDANGNPIPALVNGKSQIEWLQAELEQLLAWRNALIRAEEIVVKRRAEIAKAIEAARKRLADLREQLERNQKHRNTLQKRLDDLQKHPVRNRDAIKVVRAQIKGLDDHMGIRGRMRDALKERILPGLTDQRSKLTSLRGDLLSNLEEVHGLGSPGGILTVLPPTGVLGGRIFDVQMQLRDLLAPVQKITDTATEPSPAQLEEALGKIQLPVLQDIPRLLGLQAFATGGIVQGAPGQAVPAIVHGGEGVFTPGQMAAMGATTIQVIVQDGAVNADRIKVLANGEAVQVVDRMGANVGMGLQGIRSAPGNLAGFQ